MIAFNVTPIQVAVEVLATCAFALSGLIAALRKNLDPVGVCMVAGLTAFGGGTLRDILLDRRPFFWVEHSYWLWVLIVLCSLGIFFLKRKHIAFTERAIQIPDALGLGLFTVLGTQMALGYQMPVAVAILMGMVSAVFGGVLRDIVCNDIPKAFSDHRPYALIAFLGAALYVLLSKMQAGEFLAVSIAVVCMSGARILALYRDWELPKWKAH